LHSYDCFPSGNDFQQNHHYGDDEENVNKAPYYGAGYQPQ
jgi:hypothetical protein